jgi:hypothetical protein
MARRAGGTRSRPAPVRAAWRWRPPTGQEAGGDRRPRCQTASNSLSRLWPVQTSAHSVRTAAIPRSSTSSGNLCPLGMSVLHQRTDISAGLVLGGHVRCAVGNLSGPYPSEGDRRPERLSKNIVPIKLSPPPAGARGPRTAGAQRARERARLAGRRRGDHRHPARRRCARPCAVPGDSWQAARRASLCCDEEHGARPTAASRLASAWRLLSSRPAAASAREGARLAATRPRRLPGPPAAARPFGGPFATASQAPARPRRGRALGAGAPQASARPRRRRALGVGAP